MLLVKLLIALCVGAVKVNKQDQGVPGLAHIVASLFLESDDPKQNNKVQFEQNFHLPEDDFPKEKQNILLLAYSRSVKYNPLGSGYTLSLITTFLP